MGGGTADSAKDDEPSVWFCLAQLRCNITES